ncbi:MAG: hypothetical protein ACLFP2_05900 [Candidatus Woesearchaeota archaeon]
MYDIPPPDHYFKALYQTPIYSPSFKSPSDSYQREYLSSAIDRELKELYNGAY